MFSIFEGLPAFDGNEACSGLWAVNPDGSGLMRVTMPGPKEFDSQYFPTFSPDGGRLAFEVIRDATDGDQDYVLETGSSYLDAETGDVQPIATFPSSLFVLPRVVWSPEGDSVLIMRLDEKLSQIVEVRVKDGDEKVLFDGESLVMGGAAWAPDGSRIAFWTYRGDIWLMDADGGNRRKLVAGREPVWAPDSKRLAFFDPVDEQGFGVGEATLWLVEPDGSGKSAIAKEALHQRHHSLLWSPQAERLIFLRKAQKPIQPYGEADFYVLDLNSRREKLRARSALPLAWSQDGERILFARQLRVGPDTAIGIYIGTADGGDERLVAVTDEEDINIGSYPVWQPGPSRLAPATGAIAPSKQYDFCIRKLERFRSQLSKRS